MKVKATLICPAGCLHKLILDRRHPASHCGMGVMRVACTSKIIDGAYLLQNPSAVIITTDVNAVCNALGMPDSPQVRGEGGGDA